MQASETTTKIAPALLKAQKAIGAATKGSVNPHFKNKYADLATVIEACKEHLNSAGLSFLQTFSNDDKGVTVHTTLLHESGERVSSSLWLPVTQLTPQAYGSAITYGKRYGLQSFLGIPSEDDDGEKASEAAPKRADGGARRELVDTFMNMSPEEQRFILDTATKVMDAFKEHGPAAAAEVCAKANLDVDEKTALWAQLPSHVRSGIKSAGAKSNGVADKVAPLAAQA